MKKYLVRPFDVLYFRGNKSFDFGEWYSEGVFPPYPSTFQGFVRTAFLKKEELIYPNGELADKEKARSLVGDDGEMAFSICGPYLYHSSSFYLSLPFDIQPAEDCCAEQIALSGKGLMTDLGHKLHYADFGNQKPKFLDGTCSLQQFTEYRKSGVIEKLDNGNGDAEKEKFKLVETENHVGICLDYGYNGSRKKQAKESLFYMTPYIRFHQDTRLYFETDKDDIDLNNVDNKLGSEGRAAICENTDSRLDFAMPGEFYKELADKKQFKLILLQPGLFVNGWLPFPDGKSVDGFKVLKYKGMNLKLLYARTTSIVKISGMSMRMQAEKKINAYGLKPMLNAVPAGAVYYFEILDSDSNPADSLESLDGGKIKAPDEKYEKMGFNQVVIGKI